MSKHEVIIHRYTDPDRLSLARRAATFKGKPDKDNRKRPLQFIQFGHMSIFRGESLSVELYTKKPVYDHLITYTTIAGRYCAGLRANEAADFDTIEELQETAGKIRDEYLAFARGIDAETNDPHEKLKLEQARDIAPMCAMVRYELEINFLTFIHMMKDRQWISGFQKETGEVMEQLWDMVVDYDPELWGVVYEYYGPHVWEWMNALHNVRGFNLNRYLHGEPRPPQSLGDFLEKIMQVPEGKHHVFWENLYDYFGKDVDQPLEKLIIKHYCKIPKVW